MWYGEIGREYHGVDRINKQGNHSVSDKMTTSQEPIAIIGMACIFPQAPDIRQFWQNILGEVDAISEPQPEWEADRYLNSNRINTPYGGYLRDLYRFDPGTFGIIPNSVDGGEPDQFIALHVTYNALRDAGYVRDDYDHRETGIILGHSTYLHRGQGNLIQHNLVLDQTVELLEAILPSLTNDKLSRIRKLLKKRLPQFNADIVPGLVPNVMTGRIANRLNLKGPNYLIDAACSSSLLAVSAAMDELRNDRSRIMIAGGVNASLPAEVSVIFTQLGALSGRGKVRPFEAGSDGTLLGEGLGVVVLKKLSDASEDGDRVYAVIHEVGQASDGRGHGLLAPSIEGEALAIERAYAKSKIDPETVEVVEAHGTGIPLGDKTEIAALKKIFGTRKGPQGTIAIGSVKSMISHCIPAAGIAGMIKSALALHHKVIPPTLCDKVNPELGIEGTPFYVNTKAKPWISRPGTPRRSGINSFGFGGINTHAILEESPQNTSQPLKLSSWPAELCIFAGQDLESLKGNLQQVVKIIGEHDSLELGDIAASLAAMDTDTDYRLAMVVKDKADLDKKIRQALNRLEKESSLRWSTRGGVFFSSSPLEGKLAFMFPGEGSQYLHMFEDVSLCFDEVREWFDFWRALYPSKSGESRTDIIFPPQSELTGPRREKLEKRLHEMDVGSEAVFIGGQAMNSLLYSMGIEPDVMVGHSTGESSALAASGAIAVSELSQLADFIRELNVVYQHVLEQGKIPTGALLTVGALSRTELEEHLGAYGDQVVIAMDNCANQLVLFGEEDTILSLQKTLISAGGICILLPFDRGYHTENFSAVSEAFLKYYASIGLKSPNLPLYSCAKADLFPKSAKGVRSLAAGQWSTRVRFRETVGKMYEDGVRYFIEVGPSGNLSAFVNDILAKKEFLAIPSNLRQKNGVEQILVLMAQLYINKKSVNLGRLFESRCVKNKLFSGEELKTNPGMLLDNTMPVLHLTENDRSELHEMTTSAGSVSQENVHNGFRSEDTEQMSFAIPSTADDQGPDEVMTDYFDLMRSFLDQQNSLIERLGFTEEVYQDGSRNVEDFIPFLDTIIERTDLRVEAQCHLAVQQDNFLHDHILSGPVSDKNEDLLGLSCVPLMVSLEIMAEACCLLANTPVVTTIENVAAYGWIALDSEETTLNVQAEALLSKNDTFRAQIISDGKVAVTADFCFDDDRRLGSLPDLTERQEFRWPGRELYYIGMFHGPIFQSIRRVDAWDQQGIDAELSEVSLDNFFAKGSRANLVLNPVLLDAFGQLAAYWIAQQIGTDFNCFPSTIERIELYEGCPSDVQGLMLKARQQPVDQAADTIDGARAWQFECCDSQGRPLVRAVNLVNVFFSVPHRFYQFRRDPLNGFLGEPNSAVTNESTLLWELPHFSENFCSQSSGIFMRILALALLDHEERDQWRELTGNIRYKRQWLLGRACIKEAVRSWIYQRTGELIHAADIIVHHDEMGAPFVDGWWRDSIIQAPAVSLSHDREKSLAAVCFPNKRVGVDMEHMSRIRHPDLIEGSLTKSEQALLGGLTDSHLTEKVLRIWCAKEAAAKYLGLGLQGRPEEFEVEFFDNGWDKARVNYNDTVVELAVVCENDSIVALATDHSV